MKMKLRPMTLALLGAIVGKGMGKGEGIDSELNGVVKIPVSF